MDGPPKRMLKFGSIATCLLSLLLGCIGRDAADQVNFKAPPGWTSTPSIMGAQQFRDPSDGKQVILIANPTEPRPASHPPSEVWTPIQICGNHPAMLMQMRGTLGGHDVQMDSVDTSWNGSRVMAMYSRPFGAPANPAAETAIRSICILKP